MNSLQYLRIGDFCFINVVRFEINRFHCLKQVKIGKNSFTLVDSSDYNEDNDKALNDANNTYRSFHILNCELLESIEIGQCSFFDYAGQFELSNLPSLQFIDIGFNDDISPNFCRSSFVIRGIDSYVC